MYSQFIENVQTMAKDKLITVRIKQELYDRFKVWTEGQNTNMSDTLRGYILSCIDDTARQNARQNNNSELVNLLADRIEELEATLKKFEGCLYDKLYNSLVNNLSSNGIDDKLDNSAIQSIDITKLSQMSEDVQPKEETTKDSTPPESPILSIESISPQIAPPPDNEDISIVECELTEEKTYEEAKIEVMRLNELGQSLNAIANSLDGEYLNKSGTGKKWTSTQVKRIVDDMDKKTI
jgi:hypothetical protein